MKTVDYWREHPDEFAEEVFGLKLFYYQKELIKSVCGSPKQYLPMYSRSSPLITTFLSPEEKTHE